MEGQEGEGRRLCMPSTVLCINRSRFVPSRQSRIDSVGSAHNRAFLGIQHLFCFFSLDPLKFGLYEHHSEVNEEISDRSGDDF